MIGEVVANWTGAGTDVDPYHPDLADAHPSIDWGVSSDNAYNAQITANPNAVVLRFRCDDVSFAALEADSNFLILWSEA